MNKIIEKLTQNVTPKPIKYLILSFFLFVFFIVGINFNASITNLSLTSIGILIAFISIDIIQYLHKK